MSSRGYLSIDSILVEEERVPVQFFIHAPRLGHLDATTGANDIEENQIVEVPLWLGEGLSSYNWVKINLPRIFSARVRDAMIAAPETVRLRDRSPYFYEAGLRLASSSLEESAQKLALDIQKTLAARAKLIISKSRHSGASDPSSFVETLTDLEQRLFWYGLRYTKATTDWRKGKTHTIQALPGLTNTAGQKLDSKAPEVRSVTGMSYKRKRSIGI